MTLEFEKITTEIEEMVRSAQRQQRERQRVVDEALAKLHRYATDWDEIDSCLKEARQQVDLKKYRSARPLDRIEPIDVAQDPPPSPSSATIIATDGSQILPDRHGAFLYSLINVGVIVYFHGRGEPPQQFTRPELDYPGRGGTEEERFVDSAALVGLRRDRAEMATLARSTWEFREEAKPLLAVLDQRLLYWPVVGAGEAEGSRVLQDWQDAMASIRDSGAWLAGYIARPGKQSVLTMLDTLDIRQEGFDIRRLEERYRLPALTDATLFSRLLGPGQRSKVFADVSHHNDSFLKADPWNEVCFFYLNPGRTGRQIARVDIPLWIAQDAAAVSTVHALLYEQSQILGDYPYLLARADELAVVGRRDQESLDIMIENAMTRSGLSGEATAKQVAKELARGGKSRHEL